MTDIFNRIFGVNKPVIGMVHIGALPGTPLFDAKLDLVAAARTELLALQNAGFDAVMFGNENDRPYEFKVDSASTATMAAIIGELKPDISVPFGVNVLWDPMATVALGAATGAHYNVSAEFAYSLDRRSLPDRARSAVFSSIPDAVLVSGQITGEAAALSDLSAVKAVLPDTPVMANTGVKHDTVAEVMSIADGCIVGSSIKIDGNTWNNIDPERAKRFMDAAKEARA